MPVSKVFKTKMRWERAARMECAGFSDADIALAIGVTLPGLATLKQSLEYRQLRLQISTGFITELDAELAENTEELRNRLKENVPLAMQALADLVQKTNPDPKLRMQAASEILDRDGRFMKASRTVINDQDDIPAYMTDKDQTVVDNILNAQHAPKQSSKAVTPKTDDGETIN